MKDIFSSKKVYVFDGAMGTMLQKNGFQSGKCPEEWNLSQPDIIIDIHSKYIDAGSDIIQSNTFGGNLFRLAHFNLQNKIYEINKRGIELARKASKKDTLVAASIGPLGGVLEPYGDISKEEALESFSKQLVACDEADFLNIETMQNTDEAEIAIEAARNELKDKPISVSITYQKTPTGFATLWGEEVQTVINKFEKLNVQCLGSNCGEGYEQFVELVEILAKNTKLHILAKPNAGIPKILNEEIVYPEQPNMIEQYIKVFLKHGVKVIGGCCGTTPEHIKAIKKIVNKK